MSARHRFDELNSAGKTMDGADEIVAAVEVDRRIRRVRDARRSLCAAGATALSVAARSGAERGPLVASETFPPGAVAEDEATVVVLAARVPAGTAGVAEGWLLRAARTVACGELER